MALEGFVNLIFHCFLKNEHRNKSFKIEQRIDLEVKIRLLTSLCDGFCEEKDILSDIYNDFSKLRKLRNSFFHSKIEDSVDNMSVMEDGFLYSVDFDRFVRGFPPNSKISLTEKEVETVKNTVDLVVNNIFSSMDTESQKFVENTFMREYSIDIMVNPNGELRVVSSTAKSTKYS